MRLKPKERFSYGCSTARTISSGNGSWGASAPPTGKSMSSSNALPTCRIDWRPSRGMAVAIALIGLLATCSLLLSALPIAAALVLAAMALLRSVYLARRELRREPFELVWAGGEAAPALNFASRTQSLTGARLYIRGPLASLTGQDEAGRAQCHLWWPDTLPAAARRQLRLLHQSTMHSNASASSKKNR
jgi:toxin CptA